MGRISFDPQGDKLEYMGSKQKHGAQGNIKKASLLGRSIKMNINNSDGDDQSLKLNRGSVIDFLNANKLAGEKSLKKGWRPFSKGSSDVEIQSRLLSHFGKWSELEALGDALQVQGKLKEAAHVYKAALPGSEAAFDKIVDLSVLGIQFHLPSIFSELNSRSDLKDKAVCMALGKKYEGYAAQIEQGLAPDDMEKKKGLILECNKEAEALYAIAKALPGDNAEALNAYEALQARL